jgi:hypothetical protein
MIVLLLLFGFFSLFTNKKFLFRGLEKIVQVFCFELITGLLLLEDIYHKVNFCRQVSILLGHLDMLK